MKQIGVGVIGCGNVAWVGHLPWYWENPRARIVAVCSRTEAKAKQAADMWGADAYYTALKDLLERDDIDAVSICLPGSLHYAGVIAAAEAGKYILCEKPMASTVEECDIMISVARKAGVKLVIGHTKRFSPGFRKVKEILDRRMLGDLLQLDVRWNGYIPADSPVAKQYLSNPDTAVGAFSELGVHYADMFRWLTGSEVESVTAETKTVIPYGIHEDYAVALLRFKNGVIGTIETSFDVPSPRSAWFEEIEQVFMAGTEGRIEFNVPFWTSKEQPTIKAYFLKGCEIGAWHEIEIPVVRQPGGPRAPQENSSYPFKLMIDHFVDCVINDTEPLVTGEDGRQAVKVTDAVRRSSKTGKKVFL